MDRTVHPVTSPGTDKGKKTRDRILLAAEELFWRKGYHAVGLDELLKAASVAKGNFYYYFPGKEELAVETVRRHAAAAMEELGLGAAMASLAPRDALYDLIDRMAAQLFAEEGTVRGSYLGVMAMDLAPHSPAVRAEVAAAFDALRTAVAGIIRQGVESGQLRKGLDPWRGSFLVVGLMEGGALLARGSGDRAEVGRTVAFVKEYLSR